MDFVFCFLYFRWATCKREPAGCARETSSSLSRRVIPPISTFFHCCPLLFPPYSHFQPTYTPGTPKSCPSRQRSKLWVLKVNRLRRHPLERGETDCDRPLPGLVRQCARGNQEQRHQAAFRTQSCNCPFPPLRSPPLLTLLRANCEAGCVCSYYHCTPYRRDSGLTDPKHTVP